MSDIEHSMHILGPEGDVKISWDPERTTDVEIARKAFDAAKAKRFEAFRVSVAGLGKGRRMGEFDPTAGKVILISPPGGG